MNNNLSDNDFLKQPSDKVKPGITIYVPVNINEFELTPDTSKKNQIFLTIELLKNPESAFRVISSSITAYLAKNPFQVGIDLMTGKEVESKQYEDCQYPESLGLIIAEISVPLENLLEKKSLNQLFPGEYHKGKYYCLKQNTVINLEDIRNIYPWNLSTENQNSLMPFLTENEEYFSFHIVNKYYGKTTSQENLEEDKKIIMKEGSENKEVKVAALNGKNNTFFENKPCNKMTSQENLKVKEVTEATNNKDIEIAELKAKNDYFTFLLRNSIYNDKATVIQAAVRGHLARVEYRTLKKEKEMIPEVIKYLVQKNKYELGAKILN